MSNPGSPPAPTFPNFTEMPRLLPGWAWRLLRALSVIGALAMAALLVLEPDLGLPHAEEAARIAAPLLGWTSSRARDEVERFQQQTARHYARPT